MIEAVSKMAFGNKLGVDIDTLYYKERTGLHKDYGSIILEVKPENVNSTWYSGYRRSVL